MNNNITAVVVTHNRLTLLKECIEALRIQTIPLNNIIIINNDSSDGTLEWLKTQNDLITISQKNSGSAGGFKRGLDEAMSLTTSNWFWLMDDDVEPTADCLKNLIENSSFSRCIHPLRRYLDNIDVEWEQNWDLKSNKVYFNGNNSFNSGKKICFVNVGCFEGMLIGRDIVEKIGLPNDDFFITFDDAVYGYLASKHTKVAYVNNAILIRKKSFSDEKLSNIYIYYFTRNKHLVKDFILKEEPNAKIIYITFKFIYHEVKLLFGLLFDLKYTKNQKIDLFKYFFLGKIAYYLKKTGKSI